MKLLLFDIDKTLIDRSECHHQAFQYALNEVFGADVNIEIINYHGKTDPQIAFEVLKKLNYEENLIISKLGAFKSVLSSYFLKNVSKDHIKVMAGVADLLDELDKMDLILGLITGNLESIAYAKLDHVGLGNYFKLGGFGSDHYHRDILVSYAIRRATHIYGFIPSTKNVYVVGDTPYDIQAGKTNDVLSIGLSTGIYSSQELKESGADYVLESLRDKEEFLKIIFSDRF